MSDTADAVAVLKKIEVDLHAISTELSRFNDAFAGVLTATGDKVAVEVTGDVRTRA